MPQLVVAALCLWCLVHPTSIYASDVTFVIEGGGYGHGVGMSQYGAEGLARHGDGYRSILAHYYPGTRLAVAPPGTHVRVLIGERSSVRLRCTAAITLRDRAGRTTTLSRGTYDITRDLRVVSSAGDFLSPASPLLVTTQGPPLLIDGRAYRGSLIVHRSSSGLLIVNDVPIDLYVRGVIAWEMPASWHPQALRAQAVAARSYALASLKPGRIFDLYPDQRSQMYGGVRAEQPAAIAAVVATADEVLVWNRRVASTYFSSSSGGKTADARDVWPGTRSKPYLVSVPDPYDSLSPQHHWGPYLLTAATLSDLLGLSGLTAVRTQPTASGHVAYLEVHSSGGISRFGGTVAARALGLRSTLFTIRRTDIGRSRGATPPPRRRQATSRRNPGSHVPIRSIAPVARAPTQQELPLQRGNLLLLAAGLAALTVLIALGKGHPDSPRSPVRLRAWRAYQTVVLAGIAGFAALWSIQVARTPSATHAAPYSEETSHATTSPRERLLNGAVDHDGANTEPTITAVLPRLPSAHQTSGAVLRWQQSSTASASAASDEGGKPSEAQAAAAASDEPPTASPGDDEPAKPPAPLEISDVSVHAVTPSSIQVVWRTNLPASTQGARGLASTPILWTAASAPSFEHETVFTDLASSTAYHTWLRASDEYGQTSQTELLIATGASDDRTELAADGNTILANGAPTMPTMLWDLCASDVGSKLALGIDLFMGNSCGPDSELVTRLEGRGYAVVDDSTAQSVTQDVAGVYYPDEWDASLDTTLQREDIAHAIVSPREGRLTFLTLTNHFYSRAEPLPQGKGMYRVLYTIPDVVGFDLYPLQSWCRPAFADVYDAQRELHAASGGKPTFQWIEVAPMEHQCGQIRALDPTPATVRAETWLAIAGGANGIGYFPNNWSIEVGDEISRSDWQIKELSPALLADELAATSDKPDVKLAARSLNGAIYIVAINTTTSEIDAEMQIAGLADRRVAVFAEGRTLSSTAGSIRDEFGPLAVHIYIAPPELWADLPLAEGDGEGSAPRLLTLSTRRGGPEATSDMLLRR